VSGNVEAGQVERRRITVPDPADYTGWVLADVLEREGLLASEPGVQVQDSADGDPPPRYEIRVQRPMAEAVLRTNKASDNLGAELLLRHLGALGDDPVPLGPGSLAAGVAVLREDLERIGLDPDAYRLADGSGVSHYNLISAELLVRLLVDMHAQGGVGYEVFWQSLPIAGRDGTLSSRMQGTIAEGRVRAKTGTVSGVSNLAGYVRTTSGRHLAFAILVQNFVGTSRPWRELQDRFCERLTGF
jgi:D-alanyl-D-alanine carboxypeptidase/D-alanyl-D-alanine-endopeptidase (penicillin-binding protein 4)